MFECVIVETAADPTGTVLWLHGLGADGNDFVPMVPQLVQAGGPSLRFVFPHAPVRPVTLNGGYRMRAWYDITGIDRQARQDDEGIAASDAALRSLIAHENDQGITTDRIVLAGFSQGGAQAIYSGTRLPERLAGIIGLSCYLLGAPRFAQERSPANASTPIFLAHGLLDQVVQPGLGTDTRKLLTSAGYEVDWHTYPMAHAVCPAEIAHLAKWLRRVLP